MGDVCDTCLRKGLIDNFIASIGAYEATLDLEITELEKRIGPLHPEEKDKIMKAFEIHFLD